MSFRGGIPRQVSLLPEAPTVSDADRARAEALLEDPVALEGARVLIEVRSGYWPNDTLWFVPTERDAGVLMTEGIDRGRIWTALELMRLRCRTEDPALVRRAVMAKLALGGELDD